MTFVLPSLAGRAFTYLSVFLYYVEQLQDQPSRKPLLFLLFHNGLHDITPLKSRVPETVTWK